MARCAFCGIDRTLTNEHVWSRSLIALFEKEAPLVHSPATGSAYGGESTIRDLCGPCNRAMSAADSAATAFAMAHLKGPIPAGTRLAFSTEIRRWAVKTAANQERVLASEDARPWWRGFVRYMTGEEAEPDPLDVLFAPWSSAVPDFLASQMVFAAQTIVPLVLADDGDLPFESALERGWALKVGSGVFGVMVWSQQVESSLRAHVLQSIQTFGWLPGVGSQVAGMSPFNSVTALRFGVLCSPNRLPQVTPGHAS